MLALCRFFLWPRLFSFARLAPPLRTIFLPREGKKVLKDNRNHGFTDPRCFLDGFTAAGRGDPLVDSVWLGHRLTENGGKAAFVSGAAGYVLSRALLGRLLAATAAGGACHGTPRERSQPGLLLAKCIQTTLGVAPVELDDAAAAPEQPSVAAAGAAGGASGGGNAVAASSSSSSPLPRVHVYGPARLVSGQVDGWWTDYRRNSGAPTAQGPACCSKHTIR